MSRLPMRNLVPLALFLLALPLAAQRIDSVPHALPVEAMPPATLDELARQVVAQPLDGRHDERPHHTQRFAAKSTMEPIVADFVTAPAAVAVPVVRSEEHTSELQSRVDISYAV